MEQYQWQVNAVGGGGDGSISTRLGYKSCFRLPDGKAEGMKMVKDGDGTCCLIMIVDSTPYISKYPFETYKKLDI